MGTRADFYVGRGEKAEWLGSTAWDGHPGNFERLFAAKTKEEWRSLVAAEIAGREDGTKPEDGWPWPWDDSRTTDYAYAWDEGAPHASRFGHAWFDPRGEEPDSDGPRVAFPDMTERKAFTLGKRSGVILVGG